MTAGDFPPPLAALSAGGVAALYLDIDGSLLELADDPAAVRAGDEVLELLDGLALRLEGAVALVSGRDLRSVDRIFAPRRYPAAGTHGAEIRLPGGESAPCAADPRLVVVANGLVPHCRSGLRLERKTLSLALHYRGFPYLRGDAERLAGRALAALGSGYRLKPGKDVVEVAPAAADKGRALDLLAAHPPFSGRLPIFIGDDVTDEQGFAAANRAGGASIRIGPRVRDTQAVFALDDPAGLRRWLAAGTFSF